MKNTFGQSISITVFGESHADAIGAIIDGLAPGITVDNDFIASQLTKRRPKSSIDTPRQERDEYKILSGVFEGKTTGTPISIIIPNENTRSKDYSKTRSLARPSHADYSAYCKYHGYEDYRGGGHFSGRITAAIVAAGAIVMRALNEKGIKIGTHILKCAGISDSEFSDIENEIDMLSKKDFPTISDIEGEITEKILEARAQKDSVGGILQTAIIGMPAGVGEPMFDSVEGVISRAMFSIGAIKGIEFGSGFSMADMLGSEANDEFEIRDGKIVTKTNHNGGINGGITNSMPIIFNCVVKPTPSIAKEQSTVDFINNENEKITIEGRHDPAIVRRACVVVESMCAICVADMLAQRFGTDYLGGN
ncbi:MAG: chorismate synthase [Clostridia bacterium]|nr:chorismate synthase [Clostridia bacterium]